MCVWFLYLQLFVWNYNVRNYCDLSWILRHKYEQIQYGFIMDLLWIIPKKWMIEYGNGSKVKCFWDHIWFHMIMWATRGA